MAISSDDAAATKLVTFLGKGGSGKTTAAIFAAQVSLFYFTISQIPQIFLKFQLFFLIFN